ncbi:helix-turn-helix domain-containing protein [Leptospira sanjuanensis]|uniref:helix-turn-helix domain-containing protein n=1 Tax=Leptospira sanjuanensis TaxID=2879643 RepID=UPI003873582F
MKSDLQSCIERNIFSAFILFFGAYLALWNGIVSEALDTGAFPKLKWIALIYGTGIYSFLLLRMTIQNVLQNPVPCKTVLRNAGGAGALSFIFLIYFEEPAPLLIAGELACFSICLITVVENGLFFRKAEPNRKNPYLFAIPVGFGAGILGNVIGITFYNSNWNSISNYTQILLVSILYFINREAANRNLKKSEFKEFTENEEIEEINEQPSTLNDSERTNDRIEEKNLLKEDDLKRAEERLSAFIAAKLYADDSIRLIDLSAYLGISLHQASFYLNNYKNTGFSDFINRNRMNDAVRLLSEKQNMNLLDIAFECGFNSYTSFHRACKKWAGDSPKGLRKKALL